MHGEEEDIYFVPDIYALYRLQSARLADLYSIISQNKTVQSFIKYMCSAAFLFAPLHKAAQCHAPPCAAACHNLDLSDTQSNYTVLLPQVALSSPKAGHKPEFHWLPQTKRGMMAAYNSGLLMNPLLGISCSSLPIWSSG